MTPPLTDESRMAAYARLERAKRRYDEALEAYDAAEREWCAAFLECERMEEAK